MRLISLLNHYQHFPGFEGRAEAQPGTRHCLGLLEDEAPRYLIRDRATSYGAAVTRRLRTMGIRELKARLSSVLRDVQRGDHILVTDRGRVVAELRSPDTSAWRDSPTDKARARLA